MGGHSKRHVGSRIEKSEIKTSVGHKRDIAEEELENVV